MKVLLISPLTGIVGGISIWTSNILQYLSKRNDVDVHLCDFSRTETGQMIPNPLLRICYAVRDYFRLTKLAIRQINKFDGDVIHLCSSASYLLARDYFLIHAAKKRNIKICIHFHFGRIPELYKQQNWEWRLLKSIAGLADKSIVMDKQSYLVLDNQGVTVDLLPNPLSDNVLNMIDGLQDEREDKLLLFAGHCILTKGVFELVKACTGIPGIKLRMIGAISPDMKSQLLELAGQEVDWLDIVGQVSHEETIRQMRRCDIFVLPTYTEGFPNVILESMACGCPIIASSVGAIPEILEEENGESHGVLIEPRSVDAIKASIEMLLNNPDLKTICGLNAKKRVSERYGIKIVVSHLIDIWAQTCKE